jgi:L-threonylcarbamoyladenylate synthase
LKIIKINYKNPEVKKINLIVKALESGQAVVLPTDTSYGLAVNALKSNVVGQVFKIKGRSKKEPLSIMVRDIGMASRIAQIDFRTKKLFNKFLPGPLTLIVKKKKLPKNLTAGKGSVGLRIPDHEVIKEVMTKINFPITATSANVSGKKEPYTVKEILRQYKNKKLAPDLIVDAGKLPRCLPSTIVDLTEEKIKLIRKGPMKFGNIIKSLKK